MATTVAMAAAMAVTDGERVLGTWSRAASRPNGLLRRLGRGVDRRISSDGTRVSMPKRAGWRGRFPTQAQVYGPKAREERRRC